MSQPSLSKFFVCGALAALLSWAGLGWLIRFEQREPAHPVITMAMNAGEDQSGRVTSFDTLEEAQFREYAREQGWTDTEFVTRTFVGDDNEKYVASQIAGAGPDVVIASRAQLAFFDEQGLVEPLDPYLDKWTDYQNGKLDAEMLDACRGRDGQVLGLPVLENAPGVFVIRRDWLERLGMEAPQTFAEAREVWRACTYGDPDGNGKQDTYGYELTMDSGGGHLFSLAPFMFAVRAPWYRLDENRQYVPAFNTPEAAEVLDFIKQCYQEGLFGRDVMVRGPTSATRRYFAHRRSIMTGPVFVDWFESVADQHGMGDKVQIIPFLWPDEQARERNIYGACTYLSRLRCLMRASRNKQISWRYFEYFFSHKWLSKSFDQRGQPYLRGEHLGHFGLYTTETPWRLIRTDVSTRSLIDEQLVAQVEPVEKHIIRLPLMAQWPAALGATCEVIVDYYNDRYPTADAALDEAEKRFLEVVKSR